MDNATMVKFGYPETLIHDFAHWALLLRPAQVTAGSLVLVAKGPATAFGDLDPAAFADLSTAIPFIEKLLRDRVDYEKVNYLMLMMVDPHVHFHIFPRYQGVRLIAEMAFQDRGWPGQPDLKSAVALDPDQMARMVELLK